MKIMEYPTSFPSRIAGKVFHIADGLGEQ